MTGKDVEARLNRLPEADRHEALELLWEILLWRGWGLDRPEPVLHRVNKIADILGRTLGEIEEYT